MMDKQVKLLKIHISESDKIGSKPLYEEIVKEARESGLRGATVHRGILSFGASHSIHTMKIYTPSGNLPVIIELVDDDELLQLFAERVHALIEIAGKGALVTIQEVEVLEYKPGDKFNQFKSF